MATHDYVIANGTGAAVRSDLNNALAAIVSQNSSASAPATMYAYMLWADTTAGIMKMRNGANSAWISLWELDGTFIASDISLAAGSAAAPSLFFTGDTNTGLFSPGADTVALATAGANRLHITSGGLVGIGTASPASLLCVGGNTPTTGKLSVVGDTNGVSLAVGDNTSSSLYIKHQSAGCATFGTDVGGSIGFATNEFNERARIDSSGRLLVGTSTARTDYFDNTLTAMLQVEGTNSSGAVDRACVSIVNNNNATVNESPVLILGRSNGSTVNSKTIVSNGTRCGYITFQGADGSDLIDAASIAGEVDGTPGANDMPGRLSFSTTADGASSPTERMRISNSGILYNVSTANGFIVSSTVTAGTGNELIEGKHSGTAGTAGSGTTSFRVYTNGNVQNTNNSYGAISDAKLKENIVDAGSQWSDLKSLQVRKYNLKAETNQQTHTQIGLVAQEVELISPGLVSESPDRDEEGNDLGTVTKSVNYSVLYMKAVKALQEAMERIEALEAKVTALESA